MLEKFQTLIVFFFLSFFFFLAKPEDTSCKGPLMDTSFTPPPSMLLLNETDNFITVELDDESEAKCTDGSNYKFSYSRGTGTGSKKIMFFFPGGGYCGFENIDILESCQTREQSFKGSSNFDPANGSISENFASGGYFSNQADINPVFWNWNKVKMSYCDGFLYQGYVQEPISYNGSKIWIRGYNITYSTLEWVRKNLGLFQSEEVVFTGASSGAQAILMWIPFIRNYLPSNVSMKGVIDAGLFFDIINKYSNCYLYREQMKNIVKLTNSYELNIFNDCRNRTDKLEFWKCLIPEYIIEYINISLFIINSENDYEVMRTLIGYTCLSDGLNNCPPEINLAISEQRERLLNFIFKLKNLKPTWGFWIRRCLEHFYYASAAWNGNLTSFNAVSNRNSNIREIMYEWYLNETSPNYIDLNDWSEDCPLFINKF